MTCKIEVNILLTHSKREELIIFPEQSKSFGVPIYSEDYKHRGKSEAKSESQTATRNSMSFNFNFPTPNITYNSILILSLLQLIFLVQIPWIFGIAGIFMILEVLFRGFWTLGIQTWCLFQKASPGNSQ